MAGDSEPIARSFSRVSPDSIALRISAFSRSTTAGGVFAGAITPHQVVMSKPFSPDSSSVGSSGRKDERSEEHTSELQSRRDLVCRLLLEKKKQKNEETS